MRAEDGGACNKDAHGERKSDESVGGGRASDRELA